MEHVCYHDVNQEKLPRRNRPLQSDQYDKRSTPVTQTVSCVQSNRGWNGPITFTLPRKKDGYGFTLRYFVVYPPTQLLQNTEKGFNRDSYWLANGLDDRNPDNEAFVPSTPEPLDTFFVKSVVPGSSADVAGLNRGDRIVSVNGDLIGGKRYKDVVELIQYCRGDIKLGVVPRKEDILQLVYQEYICDETPANDNNNSTTSNTETTTASKTTTTEIQLNLKNKPERNSLNSMPPPSANKWSVPITPRKSLTLENNNDIPSPSLQHRLSSGRLSSNSGSNGSTDTLQKKYDPCVIFIGGTPVINPDNRQSRSGSVTSSGSMTPHGRSGKVTPTQKRSSTNTDPCVSWVGGKPQVNFAGDSPKEQQSDGVPPYKLQNALRKEQSKKGYSVGTRLAPKQIEGVTKPGAVSNIAGLFANGNWDELASSSINSSRKKSATSVLRDDFQMKSVHKKSLDNNSSVSVITHDKKDNSMKFNLNVSVDKRKCSDSDASGSNKRYERSTSNNSAGSNKTNLSSNTSHAILLESRTVKPHGIAALVTNTISFNDGDNHNSTIVSPVTIRKRNLLGTRKISASSVENSEDEDSQNSGDENELNNWKGRRISYLAATAKSAQKSKKNKNTVDAEADDEDSDTNMSPNTNASRTKNGQKADESDSKTVIKEGPLNRKLEKSLDARKRSNARTWKPMYAVLKGHRLFCYKQNSEDGDNDIRQPIPIRGSIIEIASDYVKRKHVFRLVTSHGNEYLFQAEDTATMMGWVYTLREANPDKESLQKTSHSLKLEKCENEHEKVVKDKKGLMRRTPFGLRSSKKGRSTSDSPNNHNNNNNERKPILKSHGPGRTFGIQLYKCAKSKNIQNVPLIVEHCCNMIEDKGKELVGIYRIPGNAAAVQALQLELDTKEPEEIHWEEEKWYELNNIGSLLKSFLRQLEDPIIPNMMYKKFITVSRLPDHNDRLKSIKHLTRSLPEYHFETLQFLIRHLKVISDNCDKNKMEPRNIAIVFGPSVVRTNEMSAMVQDMSDQYKIIETLLKQCDWIFDADETSEPLEMESDTEVLSAGVSKTLMECLNVRQNMVEQEANEQSSKKSGNKFSTLRNNFSLKLKNTTKVVSPKFQKKGKSANLSQDEETDEDTSGCYSQSPPLSGKNQKVRNKFKSKETRHMNPVTNNTTQQNSDNGTTNIGTFAMNPDSPVQINFNASLRSPELSPVMDRRNTKNADLTEKTLNDIHQLNLNHDNRYEYKSMQKDDGNDSGVTSPHRLDSEDSDSGAHSSRKESFESLSGPSPLTGRRFPASNLTRKTSNSGSSNEERSPTLQNSTAGLPSITIDTLSVSTNTATTVKQPAHLTRSVRRANKSKERAAAAAAANSNQTQNGSNEPKVVNRNESKIVRRRNNPAASPRASKRDLYSILPGDGNDYEEKIRALLDPSYEGELKDNATSEMNMASPVLSRKSKLKNQTESTNSTQNTLQRPNNLDVVKPNEMVTLDGVKTPDSGLNADWWLSGNQNNYRRFVNTPKDKATALNIISSVIDSRKRDGLKSPDNSSAPPLSPVSKSGSSPSSYDTELSARVDHWKQRNVELQKKVANILGPNDTAVSPLNSYSEIQQRQNNDNVIRTTDTDTTSSLASNSGSNLSDSRIEQFDRYLQQVSDIVNVEDRDKISHALKQNTCISPQRTASTNGRINCGVQNNEKTHPPLMRVRSAGKAQNKAHVNRMSPFLDNTYSDLNYTKLYPR